MTCKEQDEDKMHPEVFSLRKLLTMNVRWNVPPYQRHFAWGCNEEKENGLVPVFWKDVKDKVRDIMEKKFEIPSYFGAVICRKHMDPAFGETFDIVDGQQRITTFFLLLIAIRDVAHEHELHMFDREIEKHLFFFSEKGKGPTKLHFERGDRETFSEISSDLNSSGRARGDEGKGRLLRLAYEHLREEVDDFVRRQAGVPIGPIGDDPKKRKKAEDAIQTLIEGFLDGFEVIVIQLREKDDAQGIFHALNGKHLELSHFDLIRNGVFLRAREQKWNLKEFLEREWGILDEEFWAERPKSGMRIPGGVKLSKPGTRPLGDVLISHALVAERAEYINAKRVVAEYQNYVDENDLTSVEKEARVLVAHANTYLKILEHAEGASNSSGEGGLARASSLLGKFGALPLAPTLLWINSPHVKDEARREEMYGLIGSYAARRAACGLGAKHYNKVAPQFISWMRSRDIRMLDARVVSQLSFLMFFVDKESTKESSSMPGDKEVRLSCENKQIYDYKGGDAEKPAQRKRRHPSLWHLLAEIERHLRSRLSQSHPVEKDLHIEHIMPPDWTERGAEQWPFPSGEVIQEQTLIERRNRLIHSLGNLTLVENPLVGSSWEERQEEIRRHSRQHMNNYFEGRMKWDEEDIRERGRYFADIIIRLWPWDSRFPDLEGGEGEGAGGE